VAMAPKGADPDGLRGRVAVVTGGTRGIGAATAQAFAAAGAHVVVTSRREQDVRRSAAQLTRRYRVEALGVECDVSKPAAVRALFKDVRGWGRGPVAALANVAGFGIKPRLWDTPLHRLTMEEATDGFRSVYEVDVIGSRLCTLHALPDMLRHKEGSIVYVSSTPALAGYKGTPYTEAKAALLGLMRDVAREYGPRGVRANAIAPGNILTEWLDKVRPAQRRVLERENPLRRFGEPREVADLILFLSGRRSSFITGQTIVIDGGTVSH
jgi:3-oxoacyl-[acyl-carrier protein] reductase